MDNLKLRFSLFFLLITQLTFSQLSNFTLTVTKTDETCTANGSLSFSVSNTTTGSSIVYSIYRLPNTTTPIAILATNTFGGLIAGDYRVIATQSIGNQSGSQQQDITIFNSIVPLTYQINGNDVVCGNDGTMTITDTNGNAVSYEIFTGPITRPLQSSNIFNGLVAGQYSVRVFDACGDGVVQTYSVGGVNPQIIITSYNTERPENCNSVTVRQILSHSVNTVIAYPLSIQYTVFPPTGSPIVFNQIELGSPFYDSASITQQIPLFPNQYYTYNFKVTDACGNVYTNNGNVVNSSVMPIAMAYGYGCNTISYSFSNATSVIMTLAPSTYPNNLPFQLPNSSFSNLVFLAENLLPGSYSFNAVDVCGTSHLLNYTVDVPAVPNPNSSVVEGCELGYGGVTISCFRNFQSVSIIAAPLSYGQTLPFDVTFGIEDESNNFFRFDNLPAGNYIFRTIDECGKIVDLAIQINGYQETNSINIIENCGSFDISLFHNSNNNNTIIPFWLQKYNPVTNQWEHPITGVDYPANTFPNTFNSISLSNNIINYNFTATGHFRIIKAFITNQTGTSDRNLCFRVLNEFDYYDQPSINKVYTFACANNRYDAIVDAVGIGNLVYRITTKNETPFLIENANNPVFLDLDPATYNFQVEDSCGNIFNITLDVPTPFDLEITPSNLCEGQTAILTAPFFPFLNYEWWKDGNVATILGTTNVLSIPSYNTIIDSGVYHVRITYANNPSSCINSVVDFDTSIFSIVPNAGEGTDISYCGNQASIDLFSLLSGNYDANGVWTETTNSGTLNNNIWDSTNVSIGVYQFKYSVTGTCDLFDESVINITLRNNPQSPIASSDSVVCNNGDLNLYATTIPNTTYNWTGPNGFTSDLQNPTITPVDVSYAGNYSVQVVDQFNCVSQPSNVDVTVSLNPEFTIDSSCIENRYVMTAIPIQSSYDPDNVTYNWTGPNNFSSASAICDITGQQTGEYTLIITNSEGCLGTNTFNVATTLCTIPKGVSANNDGDNDTFNLTGFGGVALKIFNRYGMVVYELANYYNEWNGQDINGNILPSATYYYKITFANGENKVGWVYLMY